VRALLAGYTRALELCPASDSDAMATLLINRAESFRQMTQDHLTIQDCTAALALTPNNVKALIRALLFCPNQGVLNGERGRELTVGVLTSLGRLCRLCCRAGTRIRT
jgi:hypothetical protein